MKIAQRYTYIYDDHEVEVEIKITGDCEVEVDEIFGVKGAGREYVDITEDEMISTEAAVNDCLEGECDRGEWDAVIAETRAAAQEEKPEPVWGHGPWAPGVSRVLH